VAGGAGLIFLRPSSGPRGYALASAGAGLDPREADRVSTLGAAFGVQSTSRLGLFGELR
jgi:hypothetical protein